MATSNLGQCVTPEERQRMMQNQPGQVWGWLQGEQTPLQNYIWVDNAKDSGSSYTTTATSSAWSTATISPFTQWATNTYNRVIKFFRGNKLVEEPETRERSWLDQLRIEHYNWLYGA